MFTHIHSSTIVITDKDMADDFYVDSLGWDVRTDIDPGGGYRFVTVAPTGGEGEFSGEVAQNI